MASQGTKRTASTLNPGKADVKVWDGTEWEPEYRKDLASLPEVFASEHPEPPFEGPACCGARPSILSLA